jgi:DNA-binding NtrC family response regulator
VRVSRLSLSDRCDDPRMPSLWLALHSFFTGMTVSRKAIPPRVAVIALLVNEHDRDVLTSSSGMEPLDVRFAESYEEACALASRLTAPIILFDRDWPGIEWRTAVASLAALPHRACVLLISGVADGYLWQELIRTGGYDVVPKPLRPDNVASVVKLALSYWNSASEPALSREGRKK